MVKLHLHVGHFGGALPRAERLRKRRDRKLRPVRPSRRNELWYRAELDGIVGHLRAAGREITASLKAVWPATVEDGRRARDKRRTAPPHEAVAGARRKFQNIGAVASEITLGTHSRPGLLTRNLEAVDDRLAASVKTSVGLDIRETLRRTAIQQMGPLAQEMADAAEANVALIASIPEQYFDRIQGAVADSWEAGGTVEDLADEIERIGDVTESRAALIARDQTSKLNSAFNRVRQTSIGVERYEWQTAEDERVRDSHAALDGRIFDWDAPPTVDGEPAHPGEPINCRCVASPVLDLEDATAAGAAALDPDEDASELEAA